MKDALNNVLGLIHESQIVTGVIFGMVMQFFFVSTRTWRVAVSITFSSIFVAMYVISPIIESSNIEENSDLAIGMYALSSLVSMELLSIIILFAPEAIKLRLKKMLGV